MDFEQLERAWKGSANTPGEAANAYLTQALFATLRRRRQSSARFLIFVALVMAAWTTTIVFTAATKPFPFDLAREWSVIPLVLLPWAGLLLIHVQQRRHEQAHPDPYASVTATLKGLIDENATAQRRLAVTLGLMTACLAVLALVLRQLVTVGKMTPQNATQAGALFAALLLGVGAFRVWRYVRVLKPEAARLRRLLDDYALGA